MSLTLFVDNKLPRVGILRWFRDPRVWIDYARGPVIQMSLEKFRETGYEWVARHFEEYSRIRLPRREAVDPFRPGEAKKIMKDGRAVEIKRDPGGSLIFFPMIIRKYDVADMESLGPEARRLISPNSPPSAFWQAFDEALAAAY